MDIVEQLRADRSAQQIGTGEGCAPYLMMKAAAEIKRLRDQIEVVLFNIEHNAPGTYTVAEIADKLRHILNPTANAIV